METSVKSLKLPLFDGKPEKFQVWWTRFKAYASVFSFSQAIKPGGEEHLPESEFEELDETTETGKKKIEAKKRNTVAMANLTMALTTNNALSIVYKSMNDEWPGGLAYKVIEDMLERFQPHDIISKAELRRMLGKVSMKKKDDPATLFEQISMIENRYNTSERKVHEEIW